MFNLLSVKPVSHSYAFLSKLFIWISLPLLLASCADHVPPVNAPRFRLKTSLNTFRTGSTSAAYFYTGSNKLDRIESRFVNSGSVNLDTLRFFYDSQDRLVKTEVRRISFDRRVFTYDSEGDLVLIQLYQNPYRNNPTEATYSLASQKAYRYDNNHRPVEATLTNFVYPTNAVYEFRYTYLNGNVSQASITFPDGKTTTTTYQYDDKVNVFRNLFPINGDLGYVDTEVPLGFSQNNRILSNQQLTYDGQGLLTGINQIYPDNANFNNQTAYTYEAY